MFAGVVRWISEYEMAAELALAERRAANAERYMAARRREQLHHSYYSRAIVVRPDSTDAGAIVPYTGAPSPPVPWGRSGAGKT